MNSQRMDMWFMAPFDEPQDQNMVDPANSELSPFSSALSDYEARSRGSYYGGSQMPDNASEVMLDEMLVKERRESTSTLNGEKTHTSSRRRAQNRAAQRAFRERKERRAKDLEEQLTAMTERYKDLETEHISLQQSHEKLQQTLELLTCDDEGRTSGEQLRRFLDIIQGKARTRIRNDSF